MTTSTLTSSPTAVGVEVSEDALNVTLADGRVVAVPISWYPRLSHGTARDRGNWELIGGGYGIHWPQLDEDISVEGILLGRASCEGARSFSRWKEWYHKKQTEPSGRSNGHSHGTRRRHRRAS